MAKAINPTIKPKDSAKTLRDKDNKKSVWFDQYKDCFTFSFKPVTQSMIDRISQELVQWAKNDPEAFRLEDFYFERGICGETYYAWKKKHENLQLAHKAALNFLASRREKGAATRKYTEATVFKRQHAYDPAWESDRQRDKQDKIDIAIAVKKAAMEMGESKPQVIVLSELEYKKKEEECKE